MDAPWPEPPAGALVVAIVGAESTGKSTLASALAQRIADDTGLATCWVPEYLRTWCEAAGRTPRADEQAAIAAEQAGRISAAAQRHAVVVADTTPLVTTAYQQVLFQDTGLDAAAQAWQRRCALTLLTALDLPWQADAVRDGPHSQGPLDARLRTLLVGGGHTFAVVRGRGPARLE